MKETTIPKKYMFCLADADRCPLSAKCLRHTAWLQARETTGIQELKSLLVVNPANSKAAYATDRCQYFADNTPTTYARGMMHLLDGVPYSLYRQLQAELQACFSCRSFYFSSKKGSRLITPEELRKITSLFARHGLSAPAFDSYEQDYCWN